MSETCPRQDPDMASLTLTDLNCSGGSVRACRRPVYHAQREQLLRVMLACGSGLQRYVESGNSRSSLPNLGISLDC